MHCILNTCTNELPIYYTYYILYTFYVTCEGEDIHRLCMLSNPTRIIQ